MTIDTWSGTWTEILAAIRAEGYVHDQRDWYFLYKNKLIEWHDHDLKPMQIILNAAQTHYVHAIPLSDEDYKGAEKLFQYHRMVELL